MQQHVIKMSYQKMEARKIKERVGGIEERQKIVSEGGGSKVKGDGDETNVAESQVV